jgi:nucleoside-diphosphate-sugar epimerase
VKGPVAVTGATGFIGQRLCQHLLADGYQLRVLARDPHRVNIEGLPPEHIIEGSLQDSSALLALAKGCESLVHAAGAVRGNRPGDFQRANSAGTGAVLKALQSGSPDARLILISSLAARQPELSWYAGSKRDAERLVESSDLAWTILRPPAVYGPGDREMRAIFDSMARGFAPVPGSLSARTSLVHVDDLVRAIAACLQAPSVVGRCFELDDGTPDGYDWNELATVAGRVYGRRVKLWQVPTWLLDSIAAVNLALARLSGRGAMLTPPKLRELRHPDWTATNEALTAATGWTPALRLAEGLATLRQAAQ